MTLEILTALLVVITAFYAWSTFRILKANENVVSVMEEQTEALYRPYVSARVYLVPKSPMLYLGIKNTGKTAAERLRIKLDRDYYQFGEKNAEKNLVGYHAFQNTIDSFPPEAELIFYLGVAHQVIGDGRDYKLTPDYFNITLTYEYGGKSVEEKTMLDLRPLKNSAIPPDPLVENLDGIKKAIEELVKKTT